MQIELVPVGQGLPEKQVKELLRGGWIKAGRQAIRPAGGILDPTKPELVDCDIWILPEPTILIGALIPMLYQERDEQDGRAVLEHLIGNILGVSYAEFIQGIEAAQIAQDQGLVA